MTGKEATRRQRALDKRRLAEELRTAFYARNASRFEALLVALDPRDEPTRGLYKKEPKS